MKKHIGYCKQEMNIWEWLHNGQFTDLDADEILKVADMVLALEIVPMIYNSYGTVYQLSPSPQQFSQHPYPWIGWDYGTKVV
jgi:hypothetical protein